MRLYTCIKCYTNYQYHTKQFCFTYKTKRLSIPYKAILFHLQNNYQYYIKQFCFTYKTTINTIQRYSLFITRTLYQTTLNTILIDYKQPLRTKSTTTYANSVVNMVNYGFILPDNIDTI